MVILFLIWVSKIIPPLKGDKTGNKQEKQWQLEYFVHPGSLRNENIDAHVECSVMEDDSGSTSFKVIEDINDTSCMPEENKLSTMTVDQEEVSQNASLQVEDRICAFKTEPGIEVSCVEMDPLTAVEEVEMDTMLKTEVVEHELDPNEEGEAGVSPQQFIILSQPPNETPDSMELSHSVQTKYIRIDGADGQTYVLAYSEDSLLSTAGEQKESNNQPAVSTKKVGKNRPAAPSTVVTLQPSTSSGTKAGVNPTSDGINQAWFTTRDDKTALHNNGHKWKQGQWTKEEIEILEANITNYCKDHSIKDPAEVIFEMSKDERKDFYRTVALGIQRPLFSVYRRVTRMYDHKNHRGKYTPSEMKNLKVLRAKHGNDWAAIGVALGRSASSVKDKCRLMKDNCNAGKWYPEEEERLAAAVYNLTGLKPSESITSGLSWATVAQHVGTRSEKQCRTKWLNYLNWKQQGGADWTREDDGLLIDKVSKMNVTSDTEIDWVALSQDWASVRSPQWLRGKWWALKHHIADYNKLSYPALLEQMHQALHWNLKPKFGSRQSKDSLAGSSADVYKNCIPVSLTANADGSGSFALSYCSSDEEGFQAFEVLQQWTPQIITQSTSASDSILNGAGGHIIVQTLGSPLGDGLHLSGQQQVIISTADVSPGELTEDDSAIHVSDGQDLSGDHLHESSITPFSSNVEEIITVSEYHSQESESGDQDLMTHDVFETVTSESSSDLVMGVTSSHHASSLMTSLKDPILMSSSDVECDKSQNAVLTDESSELID
ncbi:cyclin-D-binding Myb-like transcription factor 1 [Biomphalaria glabrata]|nr:cyclin-D-binding Myb-like transcription factor 1 [Biomphalaria glabrata]